MFKMHCVTCSCSNGAHVYLLSLDLMSSTMTSFYKVALCNGYQPNAHQTRAYYEPRRVCLTKVGHE